MLSKNEIKYIQSLSHKKSRLEHGQYIAEGPKIIQELLQERPQDIVCLYSTQLAEPAHGFNGIANIPSTVSTREITHFELEKISALQTPQQMLAVVKMQSNVFIPFKKDNWLLMLDGIQDPGNLGSILRIADWFGIGTVYCSTDTADIYNPKVVQAAMGSLGRIPVCYGDCASWLTNAQIPVYGTLLNGDNLFASKNLQPGIIVIGNEGRGIRPEILPYVKQALTIPRIGKAESLNAAVATGIVVAALTGH
jgi:TrmH family RNA methyltransferase